jgi:S-layer homology domain
MKGGQVMKRQFFNWLIMFLSLVAVSGFCFTPAFADEPGDDMEIQDDNFGQNYQYTWIPCFSFVSAESPGNYTTFSTFSNNYLWAMSGGFNIVGSINLPSGAYLSVARIYYKGSPGQIRMWVYRGYPGGGDPYNYEVLGSYTSGTGPSGAININRTIANGNNIYYIRVVQSFVTSNVGFFGVRLFWKRQIRTGLSHPFTDIGGLSQNFQDSIAALYQSGITTGTSPTTYSPGNPVTRAQMAAFLARALGLHWAYPY